MLRIGAPGEDNRTIQPIDQAKFVFLEMKQGTKLSEDDLIAMGLIKADEKTSESTSTIILEEAATSFSTSAASSSSAAAIGLPKFESKSNAPSNVPLPNVYFFVPKEEPTRYLEANIAELIIKDYSDQRSPRFSSILQVYSNDGEQKQQSRDRQDSVTLSERYGMSPFAEYLRKVGNEKIKCPAVLIVPYFLKEGTGESMVFLGANKKHYLGEAINALRGVYPNITTRTEVGFKSPNLEKFDRIIDNGSEMPRGLLMPADIGHGTSVIKYTDKANLRSEICKVQQKLQEDIRVYAMEVAKKEAEDNRQEKVKENAKNRSLIELILPTLKSKFSLRLLYLFGVLALSLVLIGGFLEISTMLRICIGAFSLFKLGEFTATCFFLHKERQLIKKQQELGGDVNKKRSAAKLILGNLLYLISTLAIIFANLVAFAQILKFSVLGNLVALSSTSIFSLFNLVPFLVSVSLICTAFAVVLNHKSSISRSQFYIELLAQIFGVVICCIPLFMSNMFITGLSFSALVASTSGIILAVAIAGGLVTLLAFAVLQLVTYWCEEKELEQQLQVLANDEAEVGRFKRANTEDEAAEFKDTANLRLVSSDYAKKGDGAEADENDSNFNTLRDGGSTHGALMPTLAALKSSHGAAKLEAKSTPERIDLKRFLAATIWEAGLLKGSCCNSERGDGYHPISQDILHSTPAAPTAK